MIWRCRDRIFDTGRRAVVAGIHNRAERFRIRIASEKIVELVL